MKPKKLPILFCETRPFTRRDAACHVSTYRTFALLFLIAALFYACVGEYDYINQYKGERVYPAKYDTIVSKTGYERVELDLWKAGRVNAAQMKMGTVARTIVEYDGNSFVIDSACSWVNVKELTLPKLYRIKVYTEDWEGNKSIKQEIPVIPFTPADADAMEFAPPKLTLTPTSFVADWAIDALNTPIMDYHGLTYSFKDGANQTQYGFGVEGVAVRITGSGYAPGALVTIDLTFTVTPRLLDDVGTRILDRLNIKRSVYVQLPN